MKLFKKRLKRAIIGIRGDVMDKRGMSIVEIIAVVAIMGIVAGIGTVTTILIINRQRKNVTVHSLNDIYKTAKNLLYQAQMDPDVELVVVVNDYFCYVSLTDMVDGHAIDGEHFKPVDNEVYFCYYGEETWVVIGETPTTNKPTSTNTSSINSIEVTFDYTKDAFKKV